MLSRAVTIPMKQKIKYPANWTFSNTDVANNFDDHVRQSVPLYDELQEMVAHISRYFVRNDDLIIDYGCSTGNTLHHIQKYMSSYRNYAYLGIDNSIEMLSVAESRLNNATLGNNLRWADSFKEAVDFAEKPASVIISLYTMQFTNIENRQKEFQAMYNALRPGGCLIISEKTRPESAQLSEMMYDLHHDMKIRNGLSTQDNHKKSQSLRGVMEIISLESLQIALKKAGFDTVETFLRWHNFVGIICVKKAFD